MTTISGTFSGPDGTPVALGTLILTLSQDAVQTGTSWVVPQRVTVTLNSSGAIPAATTIIGNDSLTPLGTTYAAEIKTAGDTYYSIGSFSITGGTFNFNTATPTSGGVAYPFPVLQQPTSPQTITGQSLTLTPSAPLYVANLQGVTIYADQMSGADNSAKIQAAISALPTTGGTVDARALPNENSGTGGGTTIDPGTKAVTLLLGPVTYQFPQVVLETSFRIFGSGAGDQGSAQGPTVIQAADQTHDLFVITQTNQAVQGVHLKDFRVYTSSSGSGSAQRGFYIHALNGLGLWYSKFENLMIGAAGPGLDHFHGGNLVFDATVNTGFVQFNDFTNVMSWRSTNSTNGHALDLWGGCAQNVFRNCQFDGPGLNDGGTNVYIGDKTNNGQDAFPNTALFLDCTCQFGSMGWVIEGSWALTWVGTHVEALGKVWTFNTGVINGNLSSLIQGSYIVTSGAASGAGYILKDTSSVGSASINFLNNLIQQGADANVTGTTANITQMGNNGGSGGNVPFGNYLRGSLEVASTVKADSGFTQASGVTINRSTFTNVGTAQAGAMFLIRDAANGGSCLAIISDLSTVSIVSNVGGTSSFAATASPTANQIGLQVSSTQLQAKAGSSAGLSINFTQISFN